MPDNNPSGDGHGGVKRTSVPPVPSPPLPPDVAGAPKPAVPSPPLPPIKPAAPGAKPPQNAAPKPAEKAGADEFHFAPGEDASTPPLATPAEPEHQTPAAPRRNAPRNAPPTAGAPASTPSAAPVPRTPALPRKHAAAAPRTPALPRLPGQPAAVPPGMVSAAPVAPGMELTPAQKAAQERAKLQESSGLDIDTSAWRAWLDKFDPFAMWLFRVGVLGTVLSVAYIALSIFGAKIGHANVPEIHLAQYKLAALVLSWSLILMAFSSLTLALDVRALGVGLALCGAALHFGAPWFFSKIVGQTNATAAIAIILRGAGLWVLTMGVIKAAFDLMQWIAELPGRMKMRADVGVSSKAEAAQQRIAREANMLSPCWKLPFCREAIRKQCPAFLARKTCWKFGRGCYCDEEMISRIIRGESLDVIKSPTRMSHGKPPCGRCHIYLEHQGHKFRWLSPLALPATIIAMVLVWPTWEKLFVVISNSTLWNAFTFDPKNITPEAIGTTEKATSSLSPDQVAHFASIFLGILLGFFLLIYISKFIEWAIYKAKL